MNSFDYSYTSLPSGKLVKVKVPAMLISEIEGAKMETDNDGNLTLFKNDKTYLYNVKYKAWRVLPYGHRIIPPKQPNRLKSWLDFNLTG